MKKLLRSKSDRKISGLCSGIANYINVDPNVIRLITLVLILTTAILPGLVAYIIASIIIPEEGAENA